MTTIVDAIRDPQLFGSAIRDKATFAAWLVFLAALFGLPMMKDEAELYSACTGRQAAPSVAFDEAWLVCGRRAGKSFLMALIAIFLAVFRDYREFLGIGERGTVMIVAADRRQARVVMRYIRGIFELPIFARLVERETAESFDLNNRVTIEVATASIKAVRGYTLVAALCDEIAFWPQEDSASPDFEILDAIRPAMSTIPGTVLTCASSPYARRGALYDAHKRYFGKDDAPVLVWQAPTRTMNPTVPQRVIDAAMERDAAVAAAEYGAEFRSDVESFISRAAVDACVEAGVRERGELREHSYFGFVDPSGGSVDSMTLGVAHCENGVDILDAIREIKPPFSPENVAAEFAALLKSYRISRVRGDRYSGEWVREQFRKYGVDYLPSDKNKSEIYGELLPMLNSRRAVLLDDDRLLTQIVGLERKTSRGGKDSIDHAPGGHDDRVNAAAGALVLALQPAYKPPVAFSVPFSWG